MPLLEVIPIEATAPEAIVTAVRFGRRMGKTVIVVADHPGFWVNRILSPYLNEAAILLTEGVPIELIDRAMTSWGFPVGPIALLDEVGSTWPRRRAPSCTAPSASGCARPRPSAASSATGGSAGRAGAVSIATTTATRRAWTIPCIRCSASVRCRTPTWTWISGGWCYAMLNEAAMALDEGVVRSPRDGDVGALFGIGFPAFRGGPLRTIDDFTATRVVDVLRDLQDVHGSRFEPAESLVEMSAHGSRYYPA